jgi:cytosine/adenosine deaminase-related metal-dependent hydrolase
MSASPLITLKANWVLPVQGPPIAGGQVTLGPDRVFEVSQANSTAAADLDLGNCLLLPRLVNAHTHLEFSGLAEPFPATGGFPAWVREVIKWRQARELAAAEPGRMQAEAIAAGMLECRARGTGLVGEIASMPWPDGGYAVPPRAIVFLEQLGVLPGQAAERLASAKNRISAFKGGGPEVGLSPHAPYSLSRQLFDGLKQLARDQGLPVAMHVAETREEIDWLKGADNGFTQLQERLGVPARQQWRPDLRQLLAELAELERVLVIHGNYLGPRDWEVLAEHRQRMSLIYCPRTHQHFGHPRYPLPELLSAGVRVAAGTDSRASTPDLDLLAELRLIRKLYPELPPEQVLDLGTRAAAEALGEADRWGVISAGASPELLVVPLPEFDVAGPVAWLLDSAVSPQLLDWRSARAAAQAVRQ